MQKIKTAIVGCGMISYIYIKNFQNLFSVIELAGICDNNEANAQEKSRLFNVIICGKMSFSVDFFLLSRYNVIEFYYTSSVIVRDQYGTL